MREKTVDQLARMINVVIGKMVNSFAYTPYTAIANPDAVGLRGDATNTAVVTVNGSAVQSDDITSETIPWHFALDADNAAGPDYPLAEIAAVINPPGTNNPDVVTSKTGRVFVAKTPEQFTYDDDGSAPSEARRFLQGESPCRVRTSHPLVPSVGTVEEESHPNDIV